VSALSLHIESTDSMIFTAALSFSVICPCAIKPFLCYLCEIMYQTLFAFPMLQAMKSGWGNRAMSQIRTMVAMVRIKLCEHSLKFRVARRYQVRFHM